MFGSFRIDSYGGDRLPDGSSTPQSRAVAKRNENRKKIWTRRSRTGCLTCRGRRVKCGEEKPHCERCVKGSFECGYLLPEPPEDAPVLPDHLAPESIVSQHRQAAKIFDGLISRRQTLSPELDPPYWDFMEPHAPPQFGLVTEPLFSDEVHPANFVGRTLASFIKMRSLQLGRPIRLDKDPEFKALRLSCSRNMLDLVELVKFFMAGGKMKENNYIYSCFYTLCRLSLPLHWQQWHGHIRGSVTYVKLIGGPTAMFRARRKFGSPIGFSRLMSEAIMFSTTTPAIMQISDYNDFLDRDMREILSAEFDCDLPAPLDLRIAIWHINRLRFEAALGVPLAKLTPRVHCQMEEIDDAVVDVWVAKNPVYGLDQTMALARIFRVAIRLFALLTLPRPAMCSWARSATQHHRVHGLDAYNGLRLAQRKELIQRMQDLFPKLHYQPNLRWPMVVAGVALVDGPAEEKDFVSSSLLTIWQQPIVTCGPQQCRDILHKFWESGKTEWDDCFTQPVSC
ncbi:hypothetical protein PWT90_09041 [Aphanocladium album]|nr:hypothetical protein PWT90_09041 [Aphanocladium album]